MMLLSYGKQVYKCRILLHCGHHKSDTCRPLLS